MNAKPLREYRTYSQTQKQPHPASPWQEGERKCLTKVRPTKNKHVQIDQVEKVFDPFALLVRSNMTTTSFDVSP